MHAQLVAGAISRSKQDVEFVSKQDFDKLS